MTPATTSVAIGTELPPFTTPDLDDIRIRLYASAMNDPNPVHRDPDFATSVGLPGAIAPGGMAIVALTHLVVRWAGRDAVEEIEVRLRAPIISGTALLCTGQVTEAADGRFAVRCTASDTSGTLCADGIIWVRT